MAWTQFILGRPGAEYPFDVPPEAMSIEDMPVAVLQRNLAGDLKKSVLKTSAPLITINSSYLMIDQRNLFTSLAGISDTFLSFQCRDDWQVAGEYAIPSSTTTIILPNNSITRLSALLVSLGLSSIITIKNVVTVNVPYGAGGYGNGPYDAIDYTAGGVSYADATRTITLTNTLPNSTQPVYITYTYTGWLVNMEKFSHSVKGGWLDRFNYNYQLTGA